MKKLEATISHKGKTTKLEFWHASKATAEAELAQKRAQALTQLDEATAQARAYYRFRGTGNAAHYTPDPSATPEPTRVLASVDRVQVTLFGKKFAAKGLTEATFEINEVKAPAKEKKNGKS